MDAKHEKKRLREEVIAVRDAAGPDDGAALLACFQEHVLPMLDHQYHNAVAAYWPMGSEANVRPIMRHLERRGFRIGLPQVAAKAQPLVFRPWHTGVVMHAGALGIPVPQSSEELIPNAMLVPLVAFDDTGYRVGYGGGFYDRTIERLKTTRNKPFLIGVARACQRVEAVPHESWDERLDMLITEEACLQFGFPSAEASAGAGAGADV